MRFSFGVGGLGLEAFRDQLADGFGARRHAGSHPEMINLRNLTLVQQHYHSSGIWTFPSGLLHQRTFLVTA
jgi:hypothetical protein